MAQRIASETAKAVWSAMDGKEADKQTERHASIGGDDDVINQ